MNVLDAACCGAAANRLGGRFVAFNGKASAPTCVPPHRLTAMRRIVLTRKRVIEMANVTATFTEIAGSPQEESSGQRFRATRRLRCAWADRELLRQQLLGLDMGFIQIPDLYLGHPGCYVRSVASEPEGHLIRSHPVGGVNVYDTALVTAQYETPSGAGSASTDDGGRVLIEEELTPSAQVKVGSAAGLYWADDTPLIASEAPDWILRFVEWTVTFHGLEVLPVNIFAWMGCVNKDPVISKTLGITFEAGKLLFNGGRPRRIFTATGAQGWSLTEEFTYNPFGWNKFPRGGEAVVEVLYDAEDELYEPYPPVDFTKL
ncbi:MAG: hypothetical protein NTU53_23040 [Planctomycetota bacterium]|nr:hypothetical protein [Planctomycetota bacterium]